MKIKEFSYELPQELIAQFPIEDRDQAKLLFLDRKTSNISHHKFYKIVKFFKKEDVLVLNNTRVFKARLKGKKETGGHVEILLIREIESGIWEAMVSHFRGIKEKNRIFLDQNVFATIKDKEGSNYLLTFNIPTEQIIKKYGVVPLPHYIKRPTVTSDEEYYQTVFAKKQGSIAAPTAGLHFTKEILTSLIQQGVKITEITLHIGPGTFKPIRSENIEDHNMEAEYFEISKNATDIINKGKRIFGVGTSVCRALESLGNNNKEMKEFSGSTNLFIYPGFKFKIVTGLITNFHLPCSTPLLLVCAFAAKDLIFKVYKEAIENKYRFLSYGDAMLIM